ncbi:MAG: uroporphyrinogen decarboxylase family protein [Desulfobacterales bacterium]|jgi:uroporphyrinogen decarboxylase
MTPRERIMTALALKEPDCVPFADWVEDHVKQNLLDFMGEPQLDDAEFARRLSMDAICYGVERYLAPQFCNTAVGADGREILTDEGLIQTDADLDKMILPDLSDESYFDDAKRYIDAYGNQDLAIFLGVRPGMMNTIYSMGWMDFSIALAENVKLVETIFDRYIDWNCELVEKMQPLGFDFITAYDDIAYNSGPMFSPDILRELFLPRLKRLAGTITIPWVYHSDGDLGRIFDDLLTLGMNGINPFQPPVMDIEKYKDEYGDRICLWGNIDLVYTLSRGTVEEVEAEVKQRIKKLAPGGGYILASANSITEFCKPENVLAMATAKNKYGRYPIQIN